MTDKDGKLKLGTFDRRCMEKKKSSSATSASDGAAATLDPEIEMSPGYPVYDGEVTLLYRCKYQHLAN